MMTLGNFHNGCIGRLLILIITSLCWAGACILAQPAQLDFRHYTVDDGLPSSEVYSTFQDREGFIWIGTDNGVARFDGYEFVIFDKDDGLEDMVVFSFQEDSNGLLWASTYSGMVFYFENGRFHPYAHNEITTEFKKTSYIVRLIDITEAGNMVFHVNGRGFKYAGFRYGGFMSITQAGEVRPLSETVYTGDTIYVYQRELLDLSKNRGGERAFYSSAGPANERGTELLILKGGFTYATVSLRTKQDIKNSSLCYAGVLERLGRAEVVISNHEQIAITALESGKSYRHLTPHGKVLNYAMPGEKEEEYWLFFNRGQGMKHYDFSQSRTDPNITTFLEGHSVSSGSFDQNRGLWITTLDDGIYYCPYPEQKLYSKDDETLNAKPISLALTRNSRFR